MQDRGPGASVAGICNFLMLQTVVGLMTARLSRLNPGALAGEFGTIKPAHGKTVK